MLLVYSYLVPVDLPFRRSKGGKKQGALAVQFRYAADKWLLEPIRFKRLDNTYAQLHSQKYKKVVRMLIPSRYREDLDFEAASSITVVPPLPTVLLPTPSAP